MTGFAFAVFALGLRHGADPDHLSAIDALTRNALRQAPILARFVGTLFALGHTTMVLSIAALVGFLGSRFAAHSTLLESIGAWVSVGVLLILGALNLHQLARPNDRPVGIKMRLLPAALLQRDSPWAAMPIGFLFGFGFETSSQVAAYAIAAGSDVAGALIIGLMFCLGMVCSDTLDSLFVHKLVSHRRGRHPDAMRLWSIVVAVIALAVAGYELAQLLGWKPHVAELVVSGLIVGALLVAFSCVWALPRPQAKVTAEA